MEESLFLIYINFIRNLFFFKRINVTIKNVLFATPCNNKYLNIISHQLNCPQV